MSLILGKSLAEKVRFSADNLPRATEIKSKALALFRNGLYKNGLEIQEKITPSLDKGLRLVCERLGIDRNAVHGFVYASPELQAECFSDNDERCVIRFSSSLIDLLDAEEFNFVAGHELGHFLLGHDVGDARRGYTYMLARQAQEISADRLGLIACDSIDIAARAMMKTTSGLGSHHLKFNISEFLSQLAKVSSEVSNFSHTSTHPSWVIRCRALMFFSMTDSIDLLKSKVFNFSLEKIDLKVIADLNRDRDTYVKEALKNVKEDVILWKVAQIIVGVGVFDKRRQSQVALILGSKLLIQLKEFLSGLEESEAREIVAEKLYASLHDLQLLIPDRYPEELKDIESSVASLAA